MEICFNMHEESSEYVSETKYEFKFGIQPCYSCFVRYANASLGWGTPIPHGRDENRRLVSHEHQYACPYWYRFRLELLVKKREVLRKHHLIALNVLI